MVPPVCAGVSSCQIATECLGGDEPLRLHCAKRSSAALRTALAFETEMKRRKIEGNAVDHAAIARLTAPRRSQAGDTGIASRVRRDAKNALEQRPSAAACGEHPMIAVPIVGRAVRLYKAWYALCSYCGALTRVKPHLHRYGAELCCLRCDHGMVPHAEAGDDAADTLASAGPAPATARQCRYCGECAAAGASGWKEIKAPLDIAGPNAALPEPLRRVWYCRKHYRAWVTQAHRAMPTRIILAHLAHNAKPLYGADAPVEGLVAIVAPKKGGGRKGRGKRKRRF